MYTSTTNDNYLFCVSLISNRSCTIKQASPSALAVPLVPMASALLLPSSLRTLDNDIFHGPSLFILCTILPHMPLATVLYLASNFAFPDIDFVIVHGFVGLPT